MQEKSYLFLIFLTGYCYFIVTLFRERRIKGNQTANEIASEFGIHVSLVNRWKKEATQALPLVFGETQAKQNKEIEIERERLYQKVGKLQIELDWLKKNTGHL